MVRQQSLSYPQGRAEAERGPAQPVGSAAPAGLGLAVSLLLVVGGWKALVMLRDYPAFILPAPEVVLRRLLDELAGGTLWHHTLLTLAEALGGFGLALAISLVLGYVLA